MLSIYKHTFPTNSYLLLITKQGLCPNIEHAGPLVGGVGGGGNLGQRDAIQHCPLSKTLDDSLGLHSWEHFCVVSFKPAGFWLRQRRLAPTSRPTAPPKASASTRPHCSCTQEIQVDTHKCQQWYACYLQKLQMRLCMSVTICSNVKWESTTIVVLFLSRLFLFSKGITIYISIKNCATDKWPNTCKLQKKTQLIYSHFWEQASMKHYKSSFV